MMDSSVRSNLTRTTSNSSDLFLCLTSHLSSSSNNISSKSILNPTHTRDQPPLFSLSNSLTPMFSTGAKKRGSGFENPEPSSPKVTCIGQVRIKTKKQGNKIRTLSNRIDYQTLPSNQFHQQKCLAQRNQRWVHLPLTICEALRAIGAELSCFFPCRSSPEKKEKAAGLGGGGGESGRSSCTAVFGRWLVVVQSGEREEERTEVIKQSSLRTHVLDDIEIEEEDEKFEDRLNICIPPKNALLLMRYRSDPLRISNLANKFSESTVTIDEDDEEDDDNNNDSDNEEQCELKDGLNMESKKSDNPEAKLQIFEELHEEIQENEQEILSGGSGSEAIVERGSEEDEVELIQEAENLMEEKETQLRAETTERESEVEKLERESSELPDCLMVMMCEKVKREKVKLSMEVSKETWVCTTDFIRWLPERKVKAINGSDEPKKKVNANSNPTLPAHHQQPPQQQPRSSFSFPAPAAAAAGVPMTAFVLKRCKSEPRRTAAAKIAPETCFWKNAKLEPHRGGGATFGIGAAEVGF